MTPPPNKGIQNSTRVVIMEAYLIVNQYVTSAKEILFYHKTLLNFEISIHK